nr:MAG: maturation protein [Sanya fiers-like virus 4]
MAMQRPPGDILPKERRTQKNYLDKISSDGGRTWTTIANGSVSSQDAVDFRPEYPKGAVITIPPSGMKYRKCTSYTHRSWEVGSSHPATFKGPLYGSLRDITDAGRDSNVFLSGPPALAPAAPTDMKNEAVTKALLQLADSTANMGENLATFAQTFHLFAGKTSLLYEALWAMKNRKIFKDYLWMSAKRLAEQGPLNSAAQLYLEYVYGLRPLMQDVFSVYERLRKQAGEPLLYHGRGKSRRTRFKASTSLATSYSYVARLNWESNQKANARLTARIDPEWAVLRMLNQLGLINPAALAWELVSYSFVVDWILPIGSVLNAYSAPAGLIFVDGYWACRTSESHQIYYGLVPAGSDAEKKGVHKPALYPVTHEGYFRESFNSWPQPGLWVDHDPLRGDRIFKALALGILALK